MKKCLLYDRDCIECGECLRCDLNPDEFCNNCGRCLETNGKDYNRILIDGIDLSGEEYQKWLKEQQDSTQK